ISLPVAVKHRTSALRSPRGQLQHWVRPEGSGAVVIEEVTIVTSQGLPFTLTARPELSTPQNARS
ncbi:MAG: hypothetical protein AAGF35_12985, partial [Pseudomonadota bacterium]